MKQTKLWRQAIHCNNNDTKYTFHLSLALKLSSYKFYCCYLHISQEKKTWTDPPLHAVQWPEESQFNSEIPSVEVFLCNTTTSKLSINDFKK